MIQIGFRIELKRFCIGKASINGINSLQQEGEIASYTLNSALKVKNARSYSVNKTMDRGRVNGSVGEVLATDEKGLS